jgi:hypothetical protein
MSSKLDDILGVPQSHESYGLIGFSRLTCGGKGMNLVGSSIKHDNVMRMTVYGATLRRGLSHDRFFATSRAPIVEVYLSLTQFAEAITCIGQGDGIPCTLHSVNGEHAGEPPYESKREQFVSEFEEDCAEVASRIDGLESFARSLMEKPSVTKAERADLIEQIRRLKQQIASNMPFVARSFNEQMDRTVLEAKGEVEAFVQHRIITAGLDAIEGKRLLGIADGSGPEEGVQP